MNTGLYKELIRFAETHLCEDKYMLCVYGSHASSDQRSDSDVDVFIAMERFDQEKFCAFRDFLIAIHERFHLSLDDEVPFTNKLIVTWEDMDHAVSLRPFVQEGGFHVPAIQKDRAFLGAREIRWRLLLNALTSPHLFLAGDEVAYRTYCLHASRAIVRLARAIAGNGADEERLLQALLCGPNGEQGEAFLGYKSERSEVVRMLRAIVRQHAK